MANDKIEELRKALANKLAATYDKDLLRAAARHILQDTYGVRDYTNEDVIEFMNKLDLQGLNGLKAIADNMKPI